MQAFANRTVFSSQPQTQELSPGYKRIVLLCATLAITQGAINMSAIIIALPDISKDFHLSIASAIWVITIYPLVITASASSFGRLSDIYGRERVFALGTVLFVVASILAGLTQDGLQLIVTRAVLGAAYSISWANSSALITDYFPLGERARALAISQSGGIAGQMLGLVVGGLLTDLFSWRAVFLMTLPISCLAAAISIVWLRPLSKRLPDQHLDIPGTATWTAGIALVLVGLTYVTRAQWGATQAHLAFLAAALFIAVFVFIEARVRQPVINFSLFRDRIFAAANGAMFANILSTSVIPLIIGTFYFRGFKHDTPLEAGVAVLPATAMFVVFGPLGGWLADRMGSRKPAITGVSLVVCGLIWLSFLRASAPYIEVIGAMCVSQIGAALFVGPNTATIMSAVPGAQRAMAAGIRGTVFNAGLSLSSALSVALLATQVPQSTLNAVLEGRGRFQAEQASDLFAGFQIVFLAAAAFAVLALIAVLLSDPHKETEKSTPELKAEAALEELGST